MVFGILCDALPGVCKISSSLRFKAALLMARDHWVNTLHTLIIDDVRLQVDLSPSMHGELQVCAPSDSTKSQLAHQRFIATNYQLADMIAAEQARYRRMLTECHRRMLQGKSDT